MRTYCNPLNLPYQYQHYGKAAHREAADPTLVRYRGIYYLYASMSGGFFWSEDLLTWHYHRNPNLDLYRYAPDAREVNGKLVFCASTRGKPSTLWRTEDPFAPQYEKVSEPFDFWDPNVFQDEDGRVYLYWGCDCGRPIYGVELDPETLTPVGEKKELISDCHHCHGWERTLYPGAPEKKTGLGTEILYLLMKLSGHGGKGCAFIEGAYMNKWKGKYYLQYAAPGTELATYADGCYVGESPLGPFTCQTHNPVSFKPGGFFTGAGHGSTIEDAFGNLWHGATMRISVNANFERRVGLFPAGVDEDGIFYCNTAFGDYPMEIPEGAFDARSLQPKWMLLSYRKDVTASSSEEGHEPGLAVDEDVRSCWCARGSLGEWLRLDLGQVYRVRSVQVNLADVDVPVKRVAKELRSDATTGSRWIDLDETRRTRWLLECSRDGENWEILMDKRRADTDLPNDYVELPEGVQTRYLRLTAEELPYGAKFAVSGLRVFGEGNAPAPAAATEVRGQRTDAMTAKVSWQEIPGAMGCNVRFGIAPDKLYLSHMVYGKQEVLLTGLNAGQRYWIRVDSFGEGGITEGSTIVLE